MIDVDVIGRLFDPGEPEAGPVALDGWHVNVTTQGLALRPDLAAWRVAPATLRRVWAGDDPAAPATTVALKFADETEALAVLGSPAALIDEEG